MFLCPRCASTRREFSKGQPVHVVPLCTQATSRTQIHNAVLLACRRTYPCTTDVRRTERVFKPTAGASQHTMLQLVSLL